MSAISTRLPEVVGGNSGYVELIHAVQSYKQPSTFVLDVVNILLGKSSTKQEWELLAQHCTWDTMDRELLRELARMVHANEHGHPVMLPIINLRAPHLEDYEKIAATIFHPRVRYAAKLHIWEVGVKYNRIPYAREIIRKIDPPQVAGHTGTVLDVAPHRTNPGVMDQATYNTWEKIMRGC